MATKKRGYRARICDKRLVKAGAIVTSGKKLL
jgi:hypothetical protein